MIEAIARQYITGSMWRSYSKGERIFCGIELPEGLTRDQKLSELLITPSTKGILQGISGVPEVDDVNITRIFIVSDHEETKIFKKDQLDHEKYKKMLDYTKLPVEIIDSVKMERYVIGVAEKEAKLFKEEREVELDELQVTNTTTKSRVTLQNTLNSIGINCEEGEIFSAGFSGVQAIKAMGSPKCIFYIADDLKKDYLEFQEDINSPDVIVVGDGNILDAPGLALLERISICLLYTSVAADE